MKQKNICIVDHNEGNVRCLSTALNQRMSGTVFYGARFLRNEGLEEYGPLNIVAMNASQDNHGLIGDLMRPLKAVLKEEKEAPLPLFLVYGNGREALQERLYNFAEDMQRPVKVVDLGKLSSRLPDRTWSQINGALR